MCMLCKWKILFAITKKMNKDQNKTCLVTFLQVNKGEMQQKKLYQFRMFLKKIANVIKLLFSRP